MRLECADNPTSARITAIGVECAIRAEQGEGTEKKLATFTGRAYTGAPMKPQGWWQPIVVDLAGVRIPSQHRPVLRQHDHEQIAGHTTEVKVSAEGIDVAGTFSGQAEHVAKITEPAGNGFKWQLSIGANPIRTEFLEAGESTEVNGREVSGPMTISRETELGEVSFVPLGADGATSADVSASRGGRTVTIAQVRAAFKALKAGKYSDEEIDKMSDEDVRKNFKKCMAEDDKTGDDKPKAKAKAADDDEDTKAEEEKKAEARIARLVSAGIAESLQAMNRANQVERERVSSITAAVNRHGVTQVEIETEGGKKGKVDLVSHAIAAGWSPEKAELTAIKAARPGPETGGPLVYVTNEPEMNEQVLECAILQAARHEFRLEDDSFYLDKDTGKRNVPERIQRETQADLKARYSDKVQQAAHSRFRGRIGLQELLCEAADPNVFRRHGRSLRTEFAVGELLRAQRYDMRDPEAGRTAIRADGASAMSIGNILANVQNKFMLQGYLFTEQTWRRVCGVRPVNDFKPTKSINLLGDVQFQPLGPTGELANATLGDQAFANQAQPFGRILGIPWTNIVNDDQGILSTAPIKVGMGAGLALNFLVWGIWLSMGTATTFQGVSYQNADDGNPFWNNVTTGGVANTHGAAPSGQKVSGANYTSGTNSALSSSSLQTVKQLYDKQTDPNGNPLGFDNGKPILLHPPELWITAEELCNPNQQGTLIYGGASAAKQPNVNMWKGKFETAMGRYLSNQSLYPSTYSATAFWALFDPAALAAIEVCFLSGVDVPTIQQAGPDYEFQRLGIWMRGTMHFGANPQNFRAGVKSAGA